MLARPTLINSVLVACAVVYLGLYFYVPMFSSLKYTFHEYGFTPSAPAVSGTQPTKKEIYQARKNFGVNLGSVFVLEKFIHDRFFAEDTGAELEAVTAQIHSKSVSDFKSEIEDHWKTFVTDEDWDWLHGVGVTSVRVPLGFWCVNGGAFTDNTPFSKISDVYSNAWSIFKSHYVEKAASRNISVLVDLHAVPGGANTGDHSGMSLDEPGFWSLSRYQSIALDALKFIVEDLKGYDNIAGIQVVNEATYDNPAPTQSKYYRAALHKIRKRDALIPVVISDGWNPSQWVEWVQKAEEEAGGDLGVVVDVHIYRCFDEKDKQKDPDAIINELDHTVLADVEWKADTIVGEYSGVLDGETWNKFGGDRDEKVKEYVNKEIRLFNERTSGSYFWTFKFEHGDGGEWGFVPMVNSGALPRRPVGVQNGFPSAEKRDEILAQKFEEHSNYWNNANENENYEHHRYKDGFLVGWNDAAEFAKFDGSTIGRKHAWMNARRSEHVKEKGSSGFVWEWDQGFLAGVSAFEYEAGLLQ